MRRSEYLATEKGQRSLLRHRRRDRFYASVQQEPQSKNALSLDSKRRFQVEIASQMARYRRRAYRSPLVVKMDFCVGRKNPPAIHTLAKNYLDLLMEPLPRSGIARKELLYTDDRLIRVLIVNYDFSDQTFAPGISLAVDRLANLVADVELLQRIQHGEFKDDDNVLGSQRLDPFDSDDDDDDNSFERLHDLEQDRTHIIAMLGGKAYRAMMDMALYDAQRAYLRAATVRPSGLFTLFSSILQKDRYGQFSELMGSILKQQRSLVVSSPFTIDLRHTPLENGERSAFKENVRGVLADFKQRYPILFPLRVPISITVLYVPPKVQSIDLDNLARYVVPFVNDIIQPPSTLRAWEDVEQKLDAPTRENLRARMEHRSRLPKYSITRYQVIELPRFADDPDEGMVRLVFEDGLTRDNFWDNMEGSIDKWESSLG
jgi:hypothetical protein